MLKKLCTVSTTYCSPKFTFSQLILQIVGVGLRSVFELIRESRASHPALCTKALLALLDVLQGQQPEGLKNEPIQVIGMSSSENLTNGF